MLLCNWNHWVKIQFIVPVYKNIYFEIDDSDWLQIFNLKLTAWELSASIIIITFKNIARIDIVLVKT